MIVFKFGGASVKDAEAVRNVAEIIKKYEDQDIVVVVSAMGKTTNALEALVSELYKESGKPEALLREIEQFHSEILDDLLGKEATELLAVNDKIFSYLKQRIQSKADQDYPQAYDQLVSVGELLSTKIVSGYLNAVGLKNEWLDARKLILTDKNFMEAKVDWEKTDQAISRKFAKTGTTRLWVTQGFIGGTEDQYITTLGREGSDYSAAIFANILDAERLIIWKDVPGVLNADPKHFSNTELLPNISYREAVELSYYGASVIHPKTLKPLQNKGIPMEVRSFEDIKAKGTLINENGDSDKLLPSYILKSPQVLISISPKDYSFMVEEHLSEVFSLFAKQKVKINIMQNSALSFSASVDGPGVKLEGLIKSLSESFRVKFNDDLHLLTIRHYNKEVVDELIKGREVLLEQRTRETIRFLIR
jgi:aspartate kinase